MQKAKHTTKYFIWLTVITALLLVYMAAVTQHQKLLSGTPQKGGTIDMDSTLDGSAGDEDSVEVIGTPTEDDPWKEMASLTSTWYNNTGMMYKGTLKVIDDNGEKEKVIEEHPFEYSILNNNFCYRLAEMEMMQNRNFLLAVDHENKTINLAPNTGVQTANKAFDMRAFKKVMEKGHANARVTQLGEEKIVTIDNIDDPDIQGFRIYYSPQNYRMHKMLIGMARFYSLDDENEDQNNGSLDTNTEEEITSYYYYLEISFSQVQLLGLKEKDFHPENKFIIMQNGRVSLTPAFKEYELQAISHKP